MSTCKCRAGSYEEHLRRTAVGYPGHAYKGPAGLIHVERQPLSISGESEVGR